MVFKGKKWLFIAIFLVLAVNVTAQSVTLNNPSDGYNSSSTSITFNASVIAGVNLTNVTLYGNWSGWGANETNSSGINNSNYTFNIALADGNYKWNMYACENNSNCYFAPANYSFSVDTIYPSIINPSNYSTTNVSTIINFSSNEQVNATINYGTSLSLGTIVYNTSFQINPSFFLSSLENGTLYYYNITAQDPAGNTNSSGPYNFTTSQNVDSLPPTWNETPTDFNATNTSSISVKYNASDNYAIDAFFVNDSNFSISSAGLFQNNTILTVQNYSVNISVNDTSGNILSTVITVQVLDGTDYDAPQISGVLNHSITNESATINWTTNEDSNSSVEYGTSLGLGSFMSSASLTTSHEIILTGLSDLTIYYYNVSSCDSSNNCNETGPYNFTTLNTSDDEAPTWLQNPYNFSENNETIIYADWNATDNYGVDTYFINDSNFTINASGFFQNASVLEPRNYSINVSVNDTSGNVLSSTILVEIYPYINTTPPSINTITLESYEFENNTEILVTVNVSLGARNLSSVTANSIQLTNNSPVSSETGIWNGTVNLSDNTERVTINATDILGYSSISYSANYVINNTVPIITSTYPSDGATISESSRIIFNFSTNKNVTVNYTYNSNYSSSLSENQNFSFLLNGTLNRSTTNGILDNGNHNVTLNITDVYGNNAEETIYFTVDDDVAPVISSISQSGTSSSSESGTATITVVTNEYAFCWISSQSTINASSNDNLTDLMTGNLALSHTKTVSYSSDTTITRYVSCRDTHSNNMTFANSTSFSVTVTEDDDEPSSSNNNDGGTTSSNNDDDLERYLREIRNEEQDDEEDEEEIVPVIPPNISYKKIIPVIGAQDLELNEELQNAIAKILQKDELDGREILEMLKLSEEFSKNIEVTRFLEVQGNQSNITTVIIYNGKDTLTNFMLFDRIPKEFGETTDNITIESRAGQVVIVKEDPEIVIHYDEISPQEIITIDYSTNKRVDEDILESFATEFYAEASIQSEEESKPLSVGKILAIILWAQVFWVAGFLIYYKKHHKKKKN